MQPCVATVGTFDGCHLGHQKVFDEVKRLSTEKGLPSRIITFANHPLSVIAPDKEPKAILPKDRNDIALEYQRTDRVSEMRFTPELAALTAEEFMKLIKDRYGVSVLVMGPDNSFGSDLPDRQGYIDASKRAGLQDIVFIEEKVKTDSGREISSSAIRQAIAEGRVEDVNEMCPPYEIIGKVVHGKAFGRKIGFPTMNVIPQEGVQTLAEGVYAATGMFIDHAGVDENNDEYENERHYNGVLSVSRRPSVDNSGELLYEFHSYGLDPGNRYGETIYITPERKLRDIVKFKDTKELKSAIKEDIRQAKKYHNEMFLNQYAEYLAQKANDGDEI